MTFIGIAKGEERDAGREKFFMEGKEAFMLPHRDPVLYYVQRLRDEAHRFAIGTHRAKRKKDIVKNPLDEIEGIGPTRKRALLQHFGSAKAVEPRLPRRPRRRSPASPTPWPSWSTTTSTARTERPETKRRPARSALAGRVLMPG